jgi:hypothetical protein
MKRLVAQLIGLSLASIVTAQAPRVRDSAGVRIVENGPRFTAPIAFELGPKPTFDVGGLKNDPVEEFISRNYYLKAARLSNGNVVIIDKTRVHFYDPSGKRIKTVGREGQGPGEYMQAADVCVTRGDTVLIGQERRPVTRLSKDGELAGTIVPLGSSYAEGQFCFDDGTFVTLQHVGGFQEGETPIRMSRMSFAAPLNTIAEVRYPPYDMLISADNGKAARGSHLYSALSNTFDILAFDKTGKLDLIIRTADPLVPISDEEKAKMAPSATRMGASPAEIEEARRAAIAKSKTKFWPTHGRFMVDNAGRIWIEQDLRWDPMKPNIWAAFDSTGRILGRLVIPASPSRELRSELMGFGKDEVIFKRYDDDGAMHLTIYPILPIRK